MAEDDAEVSIPEIVHSNA